MPTPPVNWKHTVQNGLTNVYRTKRPVKAETFLVVSKQTTESVQHFVQCLSVTHSVQDNKPYTDAAICSVFRGRRMGLECRSK